MFDGDIANAMNHSRWLQIKRCIKLCDNDAAKKKGEEGYNPAYKYDYAWKALIHNINAFTYEIFKSKPHITWDNYFSDDVDLCVFSIY